MKPFSKLVIGVVVGYPLFVGQLLLWNLWDGAQEFIGGLVIIATSLVSAVWFVVWALDLDE